MFEPLPQSFYEPSAEIVAPQLLGHLLIRNTPEGPSGGPIVEVEAYLVGDPAAHSFPGETPRNRVMFGPAGYAYVYLIYGMHFCINAVCRPRGTGEAILIRAIEAKYGLPWMERNRPVKSHRDLTNGPAKLCDALGIDRSLNGANFCDADAPVFIARNSAHREFLLERSPMVTTTRVGITKAASLPLRFYLGGSHFVSKRERA
jgi:DNA-3-methyladenine glycosylase